MIFFSKYIYEKTKPQTQSFLVADQLIDWLLINVS